MDERFTIIGDPHVKNSNLDLARDLFALVEKKGLPAIWLGDLLDTKEVIRGKSLNTWIDYFKSSKLQHFVLVGNHDWFNLDCKEHSLEPLKLIPNVEVIDTPRWTPGGIGFLPYIHDKGQLKELLTKMEQGYVKVLFGHLELESFDFGNGYICKEGLGVKDFSKFSRVISGHFHKYQEKDNVTYLGTPFSHSFGEANQVKYIAEYNATTDDLQLTETPFRKHVSYEINCDANQPLDLETDRSNLHRVILTGSQENIDKFPREAYNDFSIKWITRPSDYSINDTTIEDTASNEVQFEKWAREVQKLDDYTIKLGLELLKVSR